MNNITYFTGNDSSTITSDRIQKLLDSPLSEVWFYRQGGDLQQFNTTQALLVATGDKPATAIRSIHSSADVAQQYIQPLQEMGVDGAVHTKPADLQGWEDDFIDAYRLELLGSDDVRIYLTTEHDHDTLEEHINGEHGHEDRGRFYGYPQECINAFTDPETDTHYCGDIVARYGEDDAWKVPELINFMLPDTASAHDTTYDIATDRYNHLESLDDRYDADLQPLLDDLEAMGRDALS